MNEIAYIIIRVAVTMIWVLQAAMFVRAIMSWIPGLDEKKFGDFLYALTEPFIVPVRALLDRIPFLLGFPLDMSFLVTYLLLSLLSMFLGGL